MQNERNQNLLKLWLSFFCLSLAKALASDSVGKIHAVHVNEVIRIKRIQSQRFSLWSICTRKPDGYLSHQLSPPFQGARRACGCQNARLGLSFTCAPVEPLLPHFPEWLPWQECFPRRPWLSKVFEDSKLLKCSTPSPTYPTGAEPEEQRVCGTAACSGCDTGRSQRLCSPKLRFHPSVARSHTSPQHSRHNLSDLVKIVYFPPALTVPTLWKKKKKRWRIQHLS